MQKKLISKIGDWLLASLRSAAIGRMFGIGNVDRRYWNHARTGVMERRVDCSDQAPTPAIAREASRARLRCAFRASTLP